jgi:thiamine biosynthesis lipoprotein
MKTVLRIKQLVLILLLAALAAPAGELLRLEDSMDAMGATFTVIAYGEDREKLQEGVEAALLEARRLDAMLSNYRPESEWSKVNRLAAAQPVPVSQELFDLLSACVRFSRLSDGAFDITVGPLMRVWGFYRNRGRLPAKEEIESVLPVIGYQNILLDPLEKTVRFAKPGVEIDPGGIGKGYAVDKMVEKLKEYGIRSALISAGGSSIYGLGAPPNDSGWTVRIRHPRKWSETLEELKLTNQSLSTSGDYEKFFEAGGRIYSHLMDPRTGYPAVGAASVSVLAPTTLASEAWTKPFFINGKAWAEKNKPKDLRVFICEDKAEVTCAWLP